MSTMQAKNVKAFYMHMVCSWLSKNFVASVGSSVSGRDMYEAYSREFSPMGEVYSKFMFGKVIKKVFPQSVYMKKGTTKHHYHNIQMTNSTRDELDRRRRSDEHARRGNYDDDEESRFIISTICSMQVDEIERMIGDVISSTYT